MSQASPELLERYGQLIRHKGIIGCYLQTELGHGSNVAQLETTATYIPQSDEFQIHSPTMTSTKWWIGALGKTATHGVIQAQLILPNGVNVGPHLFFIQLRSLGVYAFKPVSSRSHADFIFQMIIVRSRESTWETLVRLYQ